MRGNSQATVSWTAPASNGGLPITGYTVTSSPGGLTATTTGALSVVVGGLTNGASYTFTVTATNMVGTGAASASSAAVTPATVPTAPLNPTAVRGNAQANVAWTAPASNGGLGITSYTVTASPGGQTTTTASLNATVFGLANGTSYTFTVTATNGAGTGPASVASNAVVPATVPGPPGAPLAVRGNMSANMNWGQASANGSAITGYTVTASPGGQFATTTGALSATVNGLTNGTSYTFTVTADERRGHRTRVDPFGGGHAGDGAEPAHGRDGRARREQRAGVVGSSGEQRRRAHHAVHGDDHPDRQHRARRRACDRGRRHRPLERVDVQLHCDGDERGRHFDAVGSVERRHPGGRLRGRVGQRRDQRLRSGHGRQNQQLLQQQLQPHQQRGQRRLHRGVGQQVYAVGHNGRIVGCYNSSCSPYSSGTTDDLYSVWGDSATQVYAVGANGRIVGCYNSSCSPYSSGTTDSLRAVWGASATQVYAVGDNGRIVGCYNSSCSPYSSGF